MKKNGFNVGGFMLVLVVIVIVVAMLSSMRARGGETSIVAMISEKAPATSTVLIIGKVTMLMPKSPRICITSAEHNFCSAVSEETYTSAEVGQAMTVGIQDTHGSGHNINWVSK